MEFINMRLGKYDRYSWIKGNSQSLNALYWFLMFDPYMISRLDSIKEWIRDNPKGGIHSEFAGAHIRGDDVIIETDLRDDDRDELTLIIKKDVFIQLLNDWRKIYLKLPKEVTIYYDGEQFTFDPVY